jgi:transposase-like protein
MKLLANEGFDGPGEAIRQIINEAMRLERQNHLWVGPHERSEVRSCYVNGYKPKTVQTRVGSLGLFLLKSEKSLTGSESSESPPVPWAALSHSAPCR